MPSRMSKYHGNSRTSSSRYERNEDLYKNLYQTNDYSNISAVATLEKTNQVEIEKIKEMIRDRESYKKQKEVATIYPIEKKQETIIDIKNNFDEKTYDIRDVLTKAKETRKNDKDEIYKKNQYDYLLTSKTYNKKKEETENMSSELKEIINTITNNSELNKLSNSELSLDLLGDLKSNTIYDEGTESEAIKKIIAEEKKKSEIIEPEKDEIDKSFYTTSFKFSDKDFEDDENIIKETIKGKSNLGIKITLGIVLALITIITIYVVYINITSI